MTGSAGMLMFGDRKHLFGRFLAEANAVGAGFEEKTAGMVNSWLGKNGLGREWEARRYQKLSEDEGARDEDYSDVVVESRDGSRKFFIECKEYERSNVLNMQFDIKEDGGISPVKGKKRERLDEAEAGLAEGLVDAIRASDGYRGFLQFLNARNKWLKNLKPAMFWFDNETEDAERVLPGLIKAYNKLVKGGKVEADCKEFDAKKIRPSTANQLACALAWRLSDPDRTWDICKVDGIPNLGKMVRRHYAEGKACPAAYIQFGDDKLFRTSDENPLGLKDVPAFPEELDGEFTLKFTPRFGTGSVYVTPRSEITSELESPCSFVDSSKWPEISR